MKRRAKDINDGYNELEGESYGNPFTLLRYAFREGKIRECLEILANIHFYLFRKAPSTSLLKQWKKELAGPPPPKGAPGRDFTMKIVRNRTRSDRCYFVRVTEEDCSLDYSNESNTMGLELGPHRRIVRRGFQLHGMRP